MVTFYVYEHWRLDRGQCFYVGKGSGRRSHQFAISRNPHWQNIVNKIGDLLEVRFVAKGLTENEAFGLEIARIAYWRLQGVPIVNQTLGGDGPTGYEHTPKARELIAEASRVAWANGRPAPPLSDDRKRAIGERFKKSWADPKWASWMKSQQKGKRVYGPLSEETKRRISEQTRVGMQRKKNGIVSVA